MRRAGCPLRAPMPARRGSPGSNPPALSRIPSAEAVQIGMRALDRGTDPFVEFVLAKLAILHKPFWQPEFQAGRLTFDGNARRTAFALKAIRGCRPDSRGLDREEQGAAGKPRRGLQLIAALGNASEQAVALCKSWSRRVCRRRTGSRSWTRWPRRPAIAMRVRTAR